MLDESVKIESVSLYEVSVPFRDSFRISTGVCDVRKSLIVEIREGDVFGYGESAPFEEPFYSGETLETAKIILRRHVIPLITGRKFSTIDEFNRFIRDRIHGNHFALCSVENAYWDLVAKKNEVPLQILIEHEMKKIGVKREYRKFTDRVKSGAVIGIPKNNSIDTLVRKVNEALDEGYVRLKIKIKPGWDVKPLRVVRKLVGDDFPIWTDANASFDIDQWEVFKSMDDMNCLFHEQPLRYDAFTDLKELGNMIKTPVCLDESLISSKVADFVVKFDISRVWNVKLQRVGGLMEAIKIYKIAIENGIKLWGGTMPETGLGARFTITLSSFKGFVFSTDVADSSRWYCPGSDLVEIRVRNGLIDVPKEAGVSFDLTPERLNTVGEKIWEFTGDGNA